MKFGFESFKTLDVSSLFLEGIRGFLLVTSGDGLNLTFRIDLGAGKVVVEGVIDVDFLVSNVSSVEADKGVGHGVVDASVISFIFTNDDSHIAHGGTLRESPVVESELRGRTVLDLSRVDLVQQMGIGLVGLLFKVSNEAMASLGGATQ